MLVPAGAKSAQSLQGPESEVAVVYWLSFGPSELVSIAINAAKDAKINSLHPASHKISCLALLYIISEPSLTGEMRCKHIIYSILLNQSWSFIICEEIRIRFHRQIV